jgi:hypothetical protein
VSEEVASVAHPQARHLLVRLQGSKATTALALYSFEEKSAFRTRCAGRQQCSRRLVLLSKVHLAEITAFHSRARRFQEQAVQKLAFASCQDWEL